MLSRIIVEKAIPMKEWWGNCFILMCNGNYKLEGLKLDWTIWVVIQIWEGRRPSYDENSC